MGISLLVVHSIDYNLFSIKKREYHSTLQYFPLHAILHLLDPHNVLYDLIHLPFVLLYIALGHQLHQHLDPLLILLNLLVLLLLIGPRLYRRIPIRNSTTISPYTLLNPLLIIDLLTQGKHTILQLQVLVLQVLIKDQLMHLLTTMNHARLLHLLMLLQKLQLLEFLSPLHPQLFDLLPDLPVLAVLFQVKISV